MYDIYPYWLVYNVKVVKRMWKYIKDNNLQDPKNKQMIKCDEKLSKVTLSLNLRCRSLKVLTIKETVLLILLKWLLYQFYYSDCSLNFIKRTVILIS